MKKPNIVSKTRFDIDNVVQQTSLLTNDYSMIYNKFFETLDVVIKYDSSIVKAAIFEPLLHNALYKITNHPHAR